MFHDLLSYPANWHGQAYSMPNPTIL